MDETKFGANVPLGVLVAIFLWGLLAVLALLDTVTAQRVGAVIAGIIAGVTFTFVGWHNRHTVEGETWMRLIGSHAIYAHVLYGAAVMLMTGVISAGRVYGMDYTANLFGTVLGGSFLGLFLYFGLELDSNMIQHTEIEWFTLLFVGLLWALLFILFTAAGAFLFITAILATRVLLSLTLYRAAPDFLAVIGWHRGTGHLLALNIMVLPLTAWLLRLS